MQFAGRAKPPRTGPRRANREISIGLVARLGGLGVDLRAHAVHFGDQLAKLPKLSDRKRRSVRALG